MGEKGDRETTGETCTTWGPSHSGLAGGVGVPGLLRAPPARPRGRACSCRALDPPHSLPSPDVTEPAALGPLVCAPTRERKEAVATRTLSMSEISQ